MKRANRRTDYVLVRAYTTSEWDACSFAVFRIDDNRLNQWRKRFEWAQPFITDSGFFAHIYLDGVEGYYNGSDEWDEDDILEKGEAWAFVETDTEELERLPLPENELDTHQLVLDRNRNVRFRAFGKYTGEEFCTEEFCLGDFLNRCSHDTDN